MSDQTNTPQDFAKLLADAGLTLSAPRFRSTVGKDATKSLAKVGDRVIIAGSSLSDDQAAAIAKVAEATSISFTRETNQAVSSVRSQMVSTAKKLKVALAFQAMRDDSETIVAYRVTRTK